MIEKMKFLSITGPVGELDRVTRQYFSRYRIHLENALAELKTNKQLRPFMDANPYKEKTAAIEKIVRLLPGAYAGEASPVSLKEAEALLSDLEVPLAASRKERDGLLEERRKLSELHDSIAPFTELDINFASLRTYRFIRYRFGRIPREFYSKFEAYIYDHSDSIFYRCHVDGQYVYGVYFSPASSRHRTDAVYASMHFERIYIEMDFDEKPADEVEKLNLQIAEIDRKLENNQKALSELLLQKAPLLFGAKKALAEAERGFDIRKMAARTKNSENETFFILCGWMSEADTEKFLSELEVDPLIMAMEEREDATSGGLPPTKLKNPAIFRPFELFLSMYGLPGYDEIDPTLYLALTYSFIFGIMFGDVGQGLCLLIGGLVLYHRTKKPLLAIVRNCGFFSVIFGLLYNSFFGFEGFFPYTPLIRPKEDMLTLPIVGSINTIFVLTIAFGMLVILLNIILAILNSAKRKDAENTFFSQNAVAGLVFYGSITALIFLVMTGQATGGMIAGLLILLAVLGLLGIFLKEMLAHLVTGKRPVVEGGPMYFVQSFFETFETLLSFLSNTLSYVRIGAYAVSHVAMMEVVMMLAGSASGNLNPAMVIGGNIFVMIMEGLMVGIQVLRLEYYEMFSRFYRGDGRPFKPFSVVHPKEES